MIEYNDVLLTFGDMKTIQGKWSLPISRCCSMIHPDGPKQTTEFSSKTSDVLFEVRVSYKFQGRRRMDVC